MHGRGAECWEAVLGPPERTYGWLFNFNPYLYVSVAPETGPVETITLRWNYDE